MNENNTIHILSKNSSRRLFVHKEKIIPSPISIVVPSNRNCCGNNERQIIEHSLIKKNKLGESKDNIISTPNDFIIEVPKQTKSAGIVFKEKQPLFYEILNNAWPFSSERVETLTISTKRCQFSNEAISIKPITAVPGIGKKYGQLLADHGFIYARQLLGYYMMLKDSEMFRKWLEYKFNIPRFRAAEITSALNELVRRTL
ncbi:unnamed protein product [Rotaria socialis]|uniref:Uncharacterized protein n=1 Tax=Rotaria socialis TaxID=392032 RepID=A0A820MFR7_9BILA|nr:unnamed protein product [Rotaria socialis]CAF3688823.1 unnamed protein product [Rotaria socialis]CAF4371322.1 unnamed protein product [Rotaria socialis]